MGEKKPVSDAEKQKRKALSRWDGEGGAEPDGPQVPGVGPMPQMKPKKD